MSDAHERFRATTNQLDALPLADARFVVATDMEGPVLLGDTALDVMVETLQGPQLNGLSFGAALYRETYHWYNEKHLSAPYGQEGGDICLNLVPLLAEGMTAELVASVAARSRVAPGAKNWIDQVVAQGGMVVGVTTAWESPHRQRMQELGASALLGSPYELLNFPIDVPTTERSATLRFVDECRNICESTSRSNTLATLRARIDHFYDEELDCKPGIPEHVSHTALGRWLRGLVPLGDVGKATAVSEIQARVSPGAPVIAIGDGLNDARMLALEGVRSIAINGPDAVLAADFGVVSRDLSCLGPLMLRIADSDGGAPEAICGEWDGSEYEVRLAGKASTEEQRARHAHMRHVLRQTGDLIP